MDVINNLEDFVIYANEHDGVKLAVPNDILLNYRKLEYPEVINAVEGIIIGDVGSIIVYINTPATFAPITEEHFNNLYTNINEGIIPNNGTCKFHNDFTTEYVIAHRDIIISDVNSNRKLQALKNEYIFKNVIGDICVIQPYFFNLLFNLSV